MNLHCWVFAALLCALLPAPVWAFIDPPSVVPVHPVAGETVSVHIRSGICDGVYNVQSITREGNAIRVLFFGVRIFDPLGCNIGIGEADFPVGTYPPGDYTLQVDLLYGTIFGYRTDTIGTVNFSVTAVPAEAVAAPVDRPLALVLLLLALIGVAVCKLRARGVSGLVIALLGVASGVRAQGALPEDAAMIQVLLTTAPGAPTPEQLIGYFNRSPRSGALPLQALSVGNPQAAQYLLPLRAGGDALAWLQANSESPRAQLERYVVVFYPPGTDTAPALAALRADPYVAAASEPLPLSSSSVELSNFEVGGDVAQGTGQYGRAALNLDAAWRIVGGWALIAVIDRGLHEKGAAFRQFSDTGSYLGGNFIPLASLDVGRALLPPPNNGPIYASVDEARPLDSPNPDCSGSQVPGTLGHGTHVAGLVAANGAGDSRVQGACKHCGIAQWKVSYTLCNPSTHAVDLTLNFPAVPSALTLAADTGAQVASMSLGGPAPADYCDSINRTDPFCLALRHASDRGVAMVAASGNDRKTLNFPAADPRVIAAGGFQENLALWDESPGSTTNCPSAPFLVDGQECGSNFSLLFPSNVRQELMASARAVLSTTYPQKNYVDYARCGDGYPGPGWGNGVGLCTGTSMSAPQIAGVVGLVRSIDPLARVGLPTDAVGSRSVRGVLAATTAEAQRGQGWTQKFGYGRPDAAAAARAMLGSVEAVNRVTPLFRLYSEATQDYADVTSPQYALALMMNEVKSWRPVASLPPVPGYDSFPHGPNETLPGTPTASVYVMTTETPPRNDGPRLLPLYLMEKAYPSGRDLMLVTSKAEIEQAHANGYGLRNIQGYIYAPCKNEPSCIPAGASKFWRAYNAASNDCATFLESERPDFETDGYTGACPAGPAKLLGYVYSSYSPCGNGTATLPCRVDRIFKNGFDVL